MVSTWGDPNAVRIGLGYLEVYKECNRETIFSGGSVTRRKTLKVQTLIGESPNTGFTRTLDLIASVKYGDLPQYLALGTGTSAKTPDTPYLENEVLRVQRTSSRIADKKLNQIVPGITETSWLREHIYTVTPSASITISEWGVSESSTSGDPLVAGGLLPQPISLNAGETYTFRYSTFSVYGLRHRSFAYGLTKYTASIQKLPDFVEYLMAGITDLVHTDGYQYNLQVTVDDETYWATPTPYAYTQGSHGRKYQATIQLISELRLVYRRQDGKENVELLIIKLAPFSTWQTRTWAFMVSWSPWGDF